MRTKKPFLIALLLCTWSFVSYYLLIRQTNTTNNLRHGSMTSDDQRHQRDDLIRQLDRLETNIQEENVIHDQLVKKLIEIVRLKDKERNKPNDKHYADVDETILTENQPANRDNGIDKSIPKVIDNPISSDVQTIDANTQIIERLKLLNERTSDFKGPIIPVLVFACNRISVRNCLDDLIKYRPNANQFPIIVSQVSYVKTTIAKKRQANHLF